MSTFCIFLHLNWPHLMAKSFNEMDPLRSASRANHLKALGWTGHANIIYVGYYRWGILVRQMLHIILFIYICQRVYIYNMESCFGPIVHINIHAHSNAQRTSHMYVHAWITIRKIISGKCDIRNMEISSLMLHTFPCRTVSGFDQVLNPGLLTQGAGNCFNIPILEIRWNNL